MPQMAPINWLGLFFVCSLTFITFNILNYFSFEIYNENNFLKNKNNNNNISINKNYYNWKW